MKNQEQEKEKIDIISWVEIILTYIITGSIMTLGFYLKNPKMDIKISTIIEMVIMILMLIPLIRLENKLPKLKISALSTILIRGLSIVFCVLILFAFIAEVFNIAAIYNFCTFKPEVNFASVASIMVFSIGTFISMTNSMVTRHKEIKEKIDKETEKREKFIDDFNENLMLYIKNVTNYFDSQIANNDCKIIQKYKYEVDDIYSKILVKVGKIEADNKMIETDNKMIEDYLDLFNRINRFSIVNKKDKQDKDFNNKKTMQLLHYTFELVEKTSNLLREYKKEENIEKDIKKRFFSLTHLQ